MNRSGGNHFFPHVRNESPVSFFSSELVFSVVPKNQSPQILPMNPLDQVSSGMPMNWSEKNPSFSLFSLQQVFSVIKRNPIDVIPLVPSCVLAFVGKRKTQYWFSCFFVYQCTWKMMRNWNQCNLSLLNDL